MKVAELRTKDIAELHKLVAEKRQELNEKQRAMHAGELTNPRAITTLRRDIAQILTILNQARPETKEEE